MIMQNKCNLYTHCRSTTFEFPVAKKTEESTKPRGFSRGQGCIFCLYKTLSYLFTSGATMNVSWCDIIKECWVHSGVSEHIIPDRWTDRQH